MAPDRSFGLGDQITSTGEEEIEGELATASLHALKQKPSRAFTPMPSPRAADEEEAATPVPPPASAYQLPTANNASRVPATVGRRRSTRPSIFSILFVFCTVGVLTFVVIIFPWFVLVSPSLHALHLARLEAQTPPPPQIIEVPVPMAAEPPAEEPKITQAPEPVEPPRRPARQQRRYSPPPKPPPVADPEPEAMAEAFVAREPVPASPQAPPTTPPPPPEPPPAPAAARALSGRMAGTAGGKALIIELTFIGNGQVQVTVERGTGSDEVVGTFAMTGGVANVAFAVPGDDGGSYAVRVDHEGGSGRIALASGRSVRFKVRR